jgi:hypothetical protein
MGYARRGTREHSQGRKASVFCEQVKEIAEEGKIQAIMEAKPTG